jgi:FkbM family methyltransferase
MNFKKAIKEITRGSALYNPLRDAYQRTCNRPYWTNRKEMESFYSQFISRGDLVFDIGANVGEYTETFLRLGARVIAVEPNPDLQSGLKKIRPADRLTVESVALGASNGVADLHVSDRDVLSSLSSDWIAVAKNSDRFQGVSWSRKLQVTVLTLDALIERHGTPSFIKIDVEGFEKEVLCGLSHAPRFLSFEYNTEILETALECITQKCFSPGSEFNITLDRRMALANQRWLSSEEIIEFLRSPTFVKSRSYGDIIIRNLTNNSK